MNDNIIGWFSTEDGAHIPLRNGQTKKQAIEEKFNSNHEGKISKEKYQKICITNGVMQQPPKCKL